VNRLRIAVGGVVTSVWAVGYLWSYIDPNVKAPAEATPVMLGVVAYLFAREIKGKLGGSGDEDKA
jgi:asparagine N-glycosylation enzyme membrane subunit Stt3